MRKLTVALGFVLLAACSKPPSTPPETTAVAEPGEPGEPTQEEQPAGESVDRPQLTSADCEAQGGTVVGDIGDGAIHRPDYVCPDSGEAPIGSIVAEGGEPIAIEGAVCCK
jgi:hypothetical protein